MPVVTVSLACLWRDPGCLREIDRAYAADDLDLSSWLAAMDAVGVGPDSRDGLHDRLETQLHEGEPVEILDAGSGPDDGWARVACPGQPRVDASGRVTAYEGWVRSSHLDEAAPAATPPALEAGDARTALIDHARAHVGLRYLWGGTSPLGYDCSGLVWDAMRRTGHRVPRDAADQRRAATPVSLGDEQPGDLYFFAHPGRDVHHVGIVTAPGSMVHASETGGTLLEEELPEARRRTLVAAGRFEAGVSL